MAFDLRRLKPAELCRFVNSTPLGPVLELTALGRQRKQAGAKIGDGRTIHFLRYLAWLVLQRHGPDAARSSDDGSGGDAGKRRNERQAGYMRAKATATREIGPIPPCENSERRAACERDLELALKTYFPERFPLPFSNDHRKSIIKLQTTVLDGGRYAWAMPRHSGKTTLIEATTIWAAINGHRRFPVALGKTAEAGTEILDSIKMELETSELLLADFPEVCYPIRKLERIGQRGGGQRCQGQPTYISWKKREIILPTVPGSKASGCVINARGLSGRIRGLKKPLPGGGNLRPDLILPDDPQTEESAASAEQNRKLLRLLNGAVLGLAGPKKKIAVAMPGTPIEPGDVMDQVLDPKQYPDWRAERFQMLYVWPENMQLWDEYRKLRSESLREFGNISRATSFYRANREAMDKGAVVGWEHDFEPDELSAVQHALNLWMQDEDSFFAERQCQPRRRVQANAIRELTVDEVCNKFNGVPPGLVPLECTRLTAHIDVQHKVLYYAVVAWDERFGGGVVEYSTYPRQERSHFRAAEAHPSFQSLWPELSPDSAVYRALKELTTLIMGRDWHRHNSGGASRIGLCAIDANEGIFKKAIYQFCRESPFAANLVPAHGMGITAGKKPFDQYSPEPGVQTGLNWRVVPRDQKHLLIDTNYWKSFVASRLQTPTASAGCLSLHGQRAIDHALFADHCCSEFRTVTEAVATGRRVEEWKLRPGRPENHWWDDLVGAAAAASVLGLAWNPSGVDQKVKEGKGVSLRAMAEKKRAEFESRRRP